MLSFIAASALYFFPAYRAILGVWRRTIPTPKNTKLVVFGSSLRLLTFWLNPFTKGYQIFATR